MKKYQLLKQQDGINLQRKESEAQRYSYLKIADRCFLCNEGNFTTVFEFYCDTLVEVEEFIGKNTLATIVITHNPDNLGYSDEYTTEDSFSEEYFLKKYNVDEENFIECDDLDIFNIRTTSLVEIQEAVL